MEPTTAILYFAYGSNLNPDRIDRRIPGARPLGRAVLRGWRLAERLYADIEKARGGRVEGVVYALTPTELRRLDAYEGCPTVYRSATVTVEAELCGASAVKVPAITYMMTEATRRFRAGKKYPEPYRIVCAVGAEHWGIGGEPFGPLPPKSDPTGTVFF